MAPIQPEWAACRVIYDAVGNLTGKQDRKGQKIEYVYDALDRMAHKGYPDSSGVDYFYDLAGKIEQVLDARAAMVSRMTTWRLIGTTTQYSFLPGAKFSNAYSYDAANNRTSFTVPDGSQTSYQYDSLNRLTALTNSTTGQLGFSYDGLGRLAALGRPNEVSPGYQYDSLSRLLSVLHQAGARGDRRSQLSLRQGRQSHGEDQPI